MIAAASPIIGQSMPAARYTQGEGLAFAEVPVPTIGAGDLLLRVEAAGICGTDVKIAANGHRKLSSGQTITLGHEFIGRIAKIGDGVQGLRVGQRVGVAPNLGCGSCEMCGRALMNMCPNYTAFGITFDGAHAAYVRVPALAVGQGCVIPVSEQIAPETLVLAEPLSCVLNGMRAAPIEVGDIVVIYGAGPMGLLNVAVAANRGASRVVIADRHDDRLARANEFGATDTVHVGRESVADWSKRETNGRGVDVVITAVPSMAPQQEAMSILAPFGRLSLFAGLPRGASEVPLDTNAIHYKNLLVTGTSGGSPRDYRDALKLIESGRLGIERLVSHKFGFHQLADAYAAAKLRGVLKVVMVAAANEVAP